jgi:endo-1,4-beta-xylanase
MQHTKVSIFTNSSLFLKFALFLLIIGCNPKKDVGNESTLNNSAKGLKDYYKNYFPIGLGVDTKDLSWDNFAFLKKNFSLLSTSVAMKFRFIHPYEDFYYWEKADSLVKYAMENGMKIRGHTLIWVNSPQWLFKDTTGLKLSKAEMIKKLEQNPCDCVCPTVSRKVLLKRLKEHIHKVVGRYKGKVYAWDVLNEAIYDNNREFLKSTDWKKIIGEDYIDSVFTYAHEADPNALLFYNDYNFIGDQQKVERICRLIKNLQSKKIPIHGIGMQAHWTLDKPSIADIENEIKAYANLGMTVEITELDIPIYPSENESDVLEIQQSKNLEKMKMQQAFRYKQVFDLFRKYKKNISGVTFWRALKPDMSFGPPVIFDSTFHLSEAYSGVIDF